MRRHVGAAVPSRGIDDRGDRRRGPLLSAGPAPGVDGARPRHPRRPSGHPGRVVWARCARHRVRRAGDVVVSAVPRVALLCASRESAMMTLTLLGLYMASRIVLAGRLGLPPAWIPGALGAGALAGVVFGAVAVVAIQNP